MTTTHPLASALATAIRRAAVAAAEKDCHIALRDAEATRRAAEDAAWAAYDRACADARAVRAAALDAAWAAEAEAEQRE